MSWADSLIKLSTYEVEVLQKRLGEAEALRAREDAEHGWYQVGFLEGLRIRRAAALLEIDNIAAEEAGARDALALAFEDQKKYEQVAEGIALARRKEVARQESAAMDELGLRRAAGAR